MARRVVPTAFPTDPQLTTPDELGAAVRAARTAGGLTLEEAALAVSVAKQTLGDLEAGKPTVGLGIALRVAPRHRAGRLKQWLNYLRRVYPEAQDAFDQLRLLHDPAKIDQWLATQA